MNYSKNIVITREDINEYGIEIINDERVQRIHDNCFRDNNELKELIIPSHIRNIGMYSFSNCQNLTKIIIPSTITTIPYCCFEHCSNLKEVELPDNIEMKSHCFSCCTQLSNESKSKIPNEYIDEVKIYIRNW